MLMPSGSAPITVTRAPASVNTSGDTPAAAPWAQSSTTCRPSRSSRHACRAGAPRSGPRRPRNGGCDRPRTPVGASLVDASACSMRSSTSSGSLVPPCAKNLIPLSAAGLCDADTITPKSALMSAMRNAAAGVGMTPASSTSTPELARPADTAAAMNSPDTRVSRATTATGRRPEARRPSAIRPLPKHDCSRLSEAEGELDRQVAVRQAPDTVRAEKARHCGRPLFPRD